MSAAPTPQRPNALTPNNAIQKQATELGIDLANLPAHVAIIMDGNGRWAKKKGLQRLLGHREGYRTLRSALLSASELGVRYLTVYAFSAENWRRPEDEVKGLMKLIEGAARDELRSMHQNNVRVNVSGRIAEVPEGLRKAPPPLAQEPRSDSLPIPPIMRSNRGLLARFRLRIRKIFIRSLRKK